jgi:histidinol-phosphate aminotransferase
MTSQTPAPGGDTLQTLIRTRIRQDIVSMHGYAIQDSRGLVKLDAMENPHQLSLPLQAELGARLGALAINRYPNARVDDLRHALAAYVDMPAGCDIMLGNGSDELISLLAMAVDLPAVQNPSGQPPVIVAPEPGFVMYGMSAQFQGLRYVGVPLTADFELDEAAMLAAIRTHRPAIVYIAYPNNPTANLWDDTAIANIIALQGGQGGLVVMDEAYQPFSSRTWLTRMREAPQRHGHVLLMRTLSKFGLAGARIGYLVGQAALVAEVNKLRPPYNISSLNAECALFALEHAEVFRVQALDISAQRAIILRAFAAMPGVRAWRSDANMVLVRVPDSARAFEGMKTSGVLVKNVAKLHPLLANCLRVTVGTAEENAQMLAALAKSL